MYCLVLKDIMYCEEVMCLHFFFFKQKTAYEMRISDWSSDVCSSDLPRHGSYRTGLRDATPARRSLARLLPRPARSRECAIRRRSTGDGNGHKIGRASCRERVCQYV